MTRTETEIPTWAAQERTGDMGWIEAHQIQFWAVAVTSQAENGRGAIVVDTRVFVTNAGHPYAYLEQGVLAEMDNADLQRLVAEYDPTEEFVIMLLKSENKSSTYRVRPLPRDNTRY